MHSSARALPHLPAEPRRRARRPARALPRPARRGCCATTASTDLDRTPELEEAVFRIFLAQQRSGARRRAGHRLLQRLDRRAAADRRPGLAGRAQLLDRLVARHPAAVPGRRRPRPQRPVPLVRPAAGRRGARPACWPASATSSPRSPTTTPPDRAARIDALAAIPEQIVRFLAERLERRRPRTREPMLEVLVRRHYREYDLHDLRVLDVGGPPVRASPTTRSTSRPDPPGLHGRHPRRARRPGRAAGRGDRRRRSRPGAAGTSAVVDLYLSWPDAPEPPERGQRRELRDAARRRCRSPRDVRRVAVAVCPGGGRPVGYFTFRPEPATAHGDRRGRPGPRRAPDGRPPAEPVAAARLRRHPARGARGRAALPLRRARTTRPTSGSSRWPRCASSPSSATRTAAVIALPHAERAVANCLEAIRRARAARGAAGAQARHEPRLGAHLAGRRRRRSSS